MLRALRPSAATLALRRLIAALLVVLLSAACAEPLLADVCDGDAPRAVAGAVLPHVDGGAVVADAGDLPVVDRVGQAPDEASRDAGAPEDGDSRHAVHVCHCTHAHGGALADAYALAPRAPTRAVARAVTVRSDRLPPSPALEPQLRPPALPDAA